MDWQQFRESEITGIRNEGPNVKIFTLKATTGEGFQPGQFVILKWQNPDRESIERSYSISSFTEEWPHFELCVAYKQGGFASEKLWNLKVGNFLTHSIPQGHFLVFDEKNTDQVFICTGTGVAPFRPMIRQILDDSHFQHKVRLIFGCRTQEELLFKNEWEELQQRDSRFEYYPVLSREDWPGEKGYVHAIYERLYTHHLQARFYVCGWEHMLKEARQRLKALGFDRSKYRFEAY